MPVSVRHNWNKSAPMMRDLRTEIKKVPRISFDYIGFQAVKIAQSRAPVDKGNLKRGIKKINSGPNHVTIVSEAPYSVPVDKGHKTRQGTGRAPNYKPKPGGKKFVKANPFWTRTMKELASSSGTLSISRKMQTEMTSRLNAVITRHGMNKGTV